MSELVQGMAIRAFSQDVVHLAPEAATRVAEFDASRVYDGEPVDPHKIYNAVRTCRGNTDALGILLDQSKRDLQESVYFCNFKAWGHWDTDVGAPTPAQSSALIERMDTRFAQHARAAHELRALCAAVSDALEKAKTEAFASLNR